MQKLLLSLIFAIVCISSSAIAQEENKNVTLTVSGSGKSLDEAKQSALRGAIEQAYGAFISSKTEVLNDQVVADQMASVSSGNIQSYQILNESQLPDGTWGVTLKAQVSVNKLTNFVKSKGFAVEINGGLFSINIKQQILNEKGEIQAIVDLITLINGPMQTSTDYSIKSEEPKSIDENNKNFGIPVTITGKANQNIDFCANYFIKTLSAISLDESGIETYKKLNKNVFPVKLSYKGQIQTFYLRKKESIAAINSFLHFESMYFAAFNVDPIIKSFDKINLWQLNDGEPNSIIFPTQGDILGIISGIDVKTLKEIEKLNGYSVKPREFQTCQIRNGGIVIGKNDEVELIMNLFDLGENYDGLIDEFNEIKIGGFNDWIIPTQEILTICADWAQNMVYNDLYQSIGGLVATDGRFYDKNQKFVTSHSNYGTCYSCRNAIPTLRPVRIQSMKN